MHLDGARLWEAAAGYGRPPAEIAGLFDTAYVSFYKGIGALAGCCLAGPEDVVAEVREWRRRMGGTLFGLWPGAASALTCLRRRLPLMPAYLERAREIADAVRDLPGVTVVPDPPQTPMLHLLLRTGGRRVHRAARRLAEGGLWTWPKPMPTGDPDVVAGRALGRRRDDGAELATRSGRRSRALAGASWLRPVFHVGHPATLGSVLAHERQRQAPGWLPGNLYSV